jgi:phosphoserine phosphatase
MGAQIGKVRGSSLEFNQSNFGAVFEEKTESVSKKLSNFKNQRDDLNTEVRGKLDKRNEINSQVKELITEVQKQKALRNEANGKVAELRKVRLEKTNQLKVIRNKLRNSTEKIDQDHNKKKKGPSSRKIKEQMNKLEWRHQTGQISPSKEKGFFSTMKRLQTEFNSLKRKESESNSAVLKEVRQAEKRQQKAHDAVTEASEKSEEAHSLMMELSNEVDRLRGLANSEHMGLTSTKGDADDLHNKYIISLRCIHSMQDILKISGSKKEKDLERVDVSDLMSRLMEGQTLSDEDMMLLQRN